MTLIAGPCPPIAALSPPKRPSRPEFGQVEGDAASALRRYCFSIAVAKPFAQ